MLDMANRSIASHEKREEIWQLLRELAKALDPALFNEQDHQLIHLKVTLTTADDDEGRIVTKGQEIGAPVAIEEDDFSLRSLMSVRRFRRAVSGVRAGGG